MRGADRRDRDVNDTRVELRLRAEVANSAFSRPRKGRPTPLEGELGRLPRRGPGSDVLCGQRGPLDSNLTGWLTRVTAYPVSACAYCGAEGVELIPGVPNIDREGVAGSIPERGLGLLFENRGRSGT